MAKRTMRDMLRDYYRDKTELTIENGVLVKYFGADREFTVPEGVTAIGDRAFERNLWLETVRIPDSVTKIGRAPFHGCDKLVNVHIPAHLLEGMTSLNAMWLFTDEFMNLPSMEYWFMSRVLDGVEDYSEGFRNLFIRQLQHPFHAVVWIVKALREDKPHWVKFILSLRALPRKELEECIQRSTDAGKAEITAILLEYAQTLPDVMSLD